MKIVILAGGFGTRLSEETCVKPKPMVEIGGNPILWHIMKIYSHFGYNDFIICLGYKGYLIKEYFSNYFLHQSDVTIDIKNNSVEVHQNTAEPWKVTLINTGQSSMTGGRIKRVQKYIDGETFMLTYGDGVANVNINSLLEFHKQHSKYATVTAVQPSAKFGALNLGSNDNILSFQEKPKSDGAWVNGGFFILEPQIFDYIAGNETIWEREPMESLTRDDQLLAYRHKGFWKCVDTLRDKKGLEDLWSFGKAPWKVWKD
jgi:glucose-1-phosphate cytidylyltransferase